MRVWITNHVGALLMVVALIATDIVVVGDRTQLTQVQASVAVISAFDQVQQATNRQSSIIFNHFFVEFIAEQNYLCRIAAARAVIDHLETPSPGVCNVALGP